MVETNANALSFDSDRLRTIAMLEQLQANPQPTLTPWLPLVFQLHGHPYTLQNHFPFDPLFGTRLPWSQILKTGRQVAKSTYLSTSSTLFAVKNPHSIQLFLTPLFEQIRRFSVNYMQPLLSESPIRSYMIDSSCNQSVLQRTFLNKSLMHFSYAYLSSNRIRGIGGVWRIGIDEFQDMAQDHLPVILETMAAAPAGWGLIEKTGTPKGLDNPIEKEWIDSSQGTWLIDCPHPGCKKTNFCSAKYDLLEMIGPYHTGISEKCPGTVCAKCKKPINPRTGYWKHKYPERQWLERGFHIPQIILPMHYANAEKWRRIVAKRDGKYGYTVGKFHNEVLGESYDQGSKLLTEGELIRACSLDIVNKPNEIPIDQLAKRRLSYDLVGLGIDWGGGGGEQMSGASEKARRQRTSFTSIALMGIRKEDRKIEVLWGTRLSTPNDHEQEASQILAIVRALRPNFIAHDFTGAGAVRETLLVKTGIPRNRFVGFDYKHMPAQTGVTWIPPRGDQRDYYRIDKTKSLRTVLQAIKCCDITFFRFDNRGKEDPGVLSDFLALTEEKVETAVGDRYLIRRILALPDDFAHAVNVGAHALWHATKSFPSYGAWQHESTADVGYGNGWEDDYPTAHTVGPSKTVVIPGFSLAT